MKIGGLLNSNKPLFFMLKKFYRFFLKSFTFTAIIFCRKNFLMKIEEIYTNIHLFTLLCFMGYFWQYNIYVIKALEMSDSLGFYDEISMFAPYFPELADYDLDSFKVEFRDKAIMGQIIDQEWDNFVERWRNSGVNEWIRLHTEWYENEYNK